MVKPKQDHNRQKELYHVKAPHSADSEDNPSCIKPIVTNLAPAPLTYLPLPASCSTHLLQLALDFAQVLQHDQGASPDLTDLPGVPWSSPDSTGEVIYSISYYLMPELGFYYYYHPLN